MAFALDDDDRDSAASSDNDQDELMEDADDNDGDVDQDQDVEADEDENEDNEGDDNEDDEDDTQSSPQKSQSQTIRPGLSNMDSEDSVTSTQQPYTNGLGPTSHPRVVRTSASPRQASVPAMVQRMYPTVRPEALNATLYDIVPTMAAPQSTSINAITATPDMRYWFTGGSDCYVRKYDGAATINGKTLLTVAQRHPFVDSVTKAGVLMSYWENEEPKVKLQDAESSLSPVYSLAVQRDALWLLSGLETGTINLQSVRHDEGKRIAFLEKHTSAVSVLTLAADEKSVLSGSWDKNIFDWDLNTGTTKRDYAGTNGQISAIQVRPASSLPVPEESGEAAIPNGTFSSNNADKPSGNGGLANGVNGHSDGPPAAAAGDDAPGSPTDGDSLFGGGDADSLFGDNDGGGGTSGGGFGGDDDDEFSKVMNMGMDETDHMEQQDTSMLDPPPSTLEQAESSVPAAEASTEPPNDATETSNDPSSSIALPNGLPHAEEVSEPAVPKAATPETQDAVATSDSTFLAASFDGTIMVWDRRSPSPVARIPSRTGGPWCMDACWSPDGNYIYAGRRNNTVEEFSLHKGLKSPERIFKFPQGSGSVSALKAMPNGRHLICASHDILRLYDLKEQAAFKHSTVPFLIVPGPPRAGMISALHIDPTCKYMLSAAGHRGWEGSHTEVLIGYEIGVI